MTNPGRVDEFSNDGLRFRVRDVGPLDGQLIIALHGFPQTSTSWEAVGRRLAEAGNRVLAFDQRGYSPAARPREVSAYRVDRLAGDVLALADAVEVDRFHVVGHDWGGGVAWYLGAHHADRLHTLTAVSTPHLRALLAAMPKGQALRSWYMLWFQLPWLPEFVLRVRDGAIASWTLRRAGARNPSEAVRLLSDQGAATGAINWYRGLRVPGARPYGTVAVPTLYVWSDRDPALGRRAAVDTRRWVTGPYRFEILRGVSHWIPEERPDELADMIIGHINSHSGGGS
ncbi:MAG TPA: alpha/beta fold hydrolase [Propionibacteriaceae bacterium]|nr:alpha/beta fold hydrolase [Propionibacteriaceae bacterium]